MILNFLQTRNPPVLPCLHKRPHQCLTTANGTTSAFADDVESLQTFGRKNQESLSELLFHFFRRYGHEIDYEKHIISVREGSLISKEEKRWHLTHNSRLCVEEPFNVGRNLGNTADDTSFRGVHLELRRAFDLLAEARLEECMQQYVPPPAEERIWEKPPPKPVPVMSRSRSQSQSGRGGRGGHSNRGHRFGQHYHQHQQRNGPQGRRASSAAASQKHPNLPGLISGTPRDQQMQVQLDNLQLHDHLMNEYQLLQAQEAELRYIQQAHLRAQLQAHNANGSKTLPNGFRRSSRDESNPSTTVRQPPPTAPLHNGGVFPPFSYAVPMVSHPAVHTNPSSPSMKPAQLDLRRATQRPTNIDSAASINSRSQSQPPRPLPYTLALPSQHIDFLHESEIQQIQHSRQQQHLNQLLEAPNRARTAMLPQVPFPLERSIAESSQYVGYYVHDPLAIRGHTQDLYATRTRPHQDHYPMRGMQPGFFRIQDSSRSPSPARAMPNRDRSASARSAAAAPLGPVFMDRDRLSSSSLRGAGPVIVDGSDGWEPNWTPTNGSHRPSFGQMDDRFTEARQNALHSSTIDPDHQYQGGMHFGAIPAEGMRSRFSARPQRESQPYVDNPMSRSRENSSTSEYPRINGVLLDSSNTMPQMGTSGYNGLGIGYCNASAQLQSAVANGSSESKSSGSATAHKANMTGAQEPEGQQVPNGDNLLSPVREVATPTPSSARKSIAATPTKASLASMYPVQDIPPFKGRKKRATPEVKSTAKPIIAQIPPFRAKPTAPTQPAQMLPVQPTEGHSTSPKTNSNSPNNLSYAERVARGTNHNTAFVGQQVSRQQPHQQPNGPGSFFADISNSANKMAKGYSASYAERVNGGIHESATPRVVLGASSETPMSPRMNVTNLASEWQQSISKKHKRNKSRNANGQLGSHAEDGERKGG